MMTNDNYKLQPGMKLTVIRCDGRKPHNDSNPGCDCSLIGQTVTIDKMYETPFVGKPSFHIIGSDKRVRAIEVDLKPKYPSPVFNTETNTWSFEFFKSFKKSTKVYSYGKIQPYTEMFINDTLVATMYETYHPTIKYEVYTKNPIKSCRVNSIDEAWMFVNETVDL